MVIKLTEHYLFYNLTTFNSFASIYILKGNLNDSVAFETLCILYSVFSILQFYLKIPQEAAASCTEGQWTDAGELGTFEQPDFSWFDKNKPDLVICSSVNNPLSQKLLLHANKHLVPSIG